MQITKGFSLGKWKNYYYQIKDIGKYLQELNKITNPSDSVEKEKATVTQDIKKLVDECRSYMDGIQMKMPKPLWSYNVEEKSTWRSSDEFAYDHLINYKARNINIIRKRAHG